MPTNQMLLDSHKASQDDAYAGIDISGATRIQSHFSKVYISHICLSTYSDRKNKENRKNGTNIVSVETLKSRLTESKSTEHSIIRWWSIGCSPRQWNFPSNSSTYPMHHVPKGVKIVSKTLTIRNQRRQSMRKQAFLQKDVKHTSDIFRPSEETGKDIGLTSTVESMKCYSSITSK